jgi:hypothetical protein
MSFIIDKTVTDKPLKKNVVSQFTGNNSIWETWCIACKLYAKDRPIDLTGKFRNCAGEISKI